MPLYLTTIQLPDDFDPSTVDEAAMRDMAALGRRWRPPVLSRSSLLA